jgi:hypothetical protein
MNSEETRPSIARDESDPKHPSRNRRTILKLLIVVCLAVVPLLYAIEIMSDSTRNLQNTKERDEMFAKKVELEPNHAMPPVDAHVPANIKTATFALG